MTDSGENHTPPPGETMHWFDYRDNVDKIYWGVIAVCAVLMLIEPFYYKKPYLGFDGSFGFYGWFGFIACAGLILVAREIRKTLNRREEFYEAADTRGEDKAS